MLRDQATLSREVHDVQVARWEGFKRLARTLPNRQILAVELVRTRDDETVAVLTIVQNGEPVRYLVTGDAHGRLKARRDPQSAPSDVAAPMMAMAAQDAAADPAGIAMGEPPPKKTGTPGIVAVAGNLLSAAFDVAELVDTSAK
jgi:hypothetical protein